MKKNLSYILILFCILMGCQNNEEANSNLKPRKDIELTLSESQVTEGSSDFAFRLFSEMNKMKSEQENWLVSPFSMSMVLSMISNGAEETTLREIEKVLGHENLSIDEINAFYEKLVKELKDLDDTSNLDIANSIWAHHGVKFNDSFVDENRKYYEAEVQSLDFTSPDALKTINQWCAEQTKHTIPAIVDKISENTKLMLLNALYFNGVWKNKFEEQNTIVDDFTNSDGSVVKISMMKQCKSLPYVKNEHFAMGRFDYGNGAFNMTILLPNGEAKPNDNWSYLTAENWKNWNNSWDEQTLDVKFPKFEIESKNELNEILMSMGIENAFNEEADFSSLSDTPLQISLFEQASFLKVDESGTVISSVSKGEDVDLAPQPTPFYMNRPFAFIVSEQSTGIILMMGKIAIF